MLIGNVSFSHLAYIIDPPSEDMMIAGSANVNGVLSLEEKYRIWYRALRYRIQSEGIRSLFSR